MKILKPKNFVFGGDKDQVQIIIGDATKAGTTVYLYGEIADDSNDPKKIKSIDFVQAVNSLTAEIIHLRVNCPGGDIFAALAMQTALKQHPAKVICHIDGVAASAATRVMLGADEIEISDGGFVMIHNVASPVEVLGFLTSEDMLELMVNLEEEIGRIDAANGSVVDEYVQRTGQSPEQIKEWMAKTTFFNANEALAAGFVDRIYKGGKVLQNKWDFSGYQNCPEPLKNIIKQEQEPKADEIQPKPAVDTSALLRRLELELQY